MAQPDAIARCTPLAGRLLDEDEAVRLERVFKALGDRNRVRILNALAAAGEDSTCVCNFEEMLGLGQSTVSYHLKQLVEAGLLTRERRGTFSHYRVAPGALELLSDLLSPSEESRRATASTRKSKMRSRSRRTNARWASSPSGPNGSS